MYDFVNSTFNESTAISVYWSNSELIIVLLIVLVFIHLFEFILLLWLITTKMYNPSMK